MAYLTGSDRCSRTKPSSTAGWFCNWAAGVGSRTLPTECPHGVVLDWGDFGPSSGNEYDPGNECRRCDEEAWLTAVARVEKYVKANVSPDFRMVVHWHLTHFLGLMPEDES